MFHTIDRLKPDPILGLMAQYRADPFARKVDLGVGVYRDLSGNTPVLDSVRRAERIVLESQSTKSYVAAAGREEYNAGVERLVLGDAHPARAARRVRTAQAPGGCGALRVGAELIRAAAASTMVHLSDPTWGNHAPLLGSSGLRLERYPYYDAVAHRLQFEAMLDRLEQARAGDVVLVHASCHNPSGADLSLEQWRALSELLAQKHLMPFLDLAYQGFGIDVASDVAGLRLMTEALPEALIAVSHSKNLGLYRERIGALITISEDESRADAVQSHVLQIARSIYSMPPDHGAAIAACIFADEDFLAAGSRSSARCAIGSRKCVSFWRRASARRLTATRSTSSNPSAVCFHCWACRARPWTRFDAASHLHDRGQPHEPRRHHASQRGLRCRGDCGGNRPRR